MRMSFNNTNRKDREMKRTFIGFLVVGLLCCGGAARVSAADLSAVNAEDLIKIVDEMTPEQAYEFQNKLDASGFKPIPKGFFSRLAFDVSGGVSKFDRVDLSGITLSAGPLKVDEVDGQRVGVAWKYFDDMLRVGFSGAKWHAEDSFLSDGKYSRAELKATDFTITVAGQWIRTRNFQLWTKLGAGVGAVDLDTVDTPANSGSTVRKLNAEFPVLDVEVGMAWRFNPIISVGLSGGYRFSDEVNFEEGGKEIGAKIDPSGYTARVGLNVNF